MKRLNRRTLLRGAIAGGSVAVGLPLLDAMMPRKATAQDATAPKRCVIWFTPNGTLPLIWSPADDLSGLDQHPIHASLAPFASKLLFLDGVDQSVTSGGPGDGHQKGMGCLLTNRRLLEGNDFCLEGCEPGNEEYVGWGGGISIDQFLADQVEQEIVTKFRSLEMGVQVRNSTVWSRMSYTDADQPVPHRENPNANFTDLFSDLDADPFELELLRKRRKSVLDAVMASYSDFNKKLGYEDRIRAEQHLEAIRALELRLDANGGFGESCEVPTNTGVADWEDSSKFPDVGRAHMDMLAMAMACDMTRVGSIQWSRAVSGVNHSAWCTQIQNRGHHDMSHDSINPGDANFSQNTVDDLTQINRWYTDQFAYLLNLMNSVQEGDGTMLDNSVVLWVNELGQGSSHTRNDMPFIIAGGCQGYFNTGRRVGYQGEDHGKLLVSVAHAMGYPIADFGDPQYSDGPLPNLT